MDKNILFEEVDVTGDNSITPMFMPTGLGCPGGLCIAGDGAVCGFWCGTGGLCGGWCGP